MSISELLSKTKNKYLLGNLLAMILVIIGIIFGVRYGLDLYTHHGEAIAIPNVKHKTFIDAKKILEQVGFNVVVSDTGYIKTLPPNCVLEQSPIAGEKVKTGRIIYLIINASKSPTITLPDIIDNSSLREAIAKLTAMGFKVGKPQFIPGEKDWVYGVLVRGKHVMTGARISVEDSVIIQAGNGMRDETDSVNYIDPVYREYESNGEDDVDDFQEVTEPVNEQKKGDSKQQENTPSDNNKTKHTAPSTLPHTN